MKKERFFLFLAITLGIIVAIVLYQAAENKQLKNDEIYNYAIGSGCFLLPLIFLNIPPKIKKYIHVFFITLLLVSSYIYRRQEVVMGNPANYYFYWGLGGYMASFLISLIIGSAPLKKASKTIQSA
jgi:hypothetical protein